MRYKVKREIHNPQKSLRITYRIWPEKLGNHAEGTSMSSGAMLRKGWRRITAKLQSDIKEHKGLVQEIRQLMGIFDTLFVVHGVLGSQKEAESDFDKAQEMFETNLVNPMVLLTLVSQELEKQGPDQIAVITSVAGDRGRQSNS